MKKMKYLFMLLIMCFVFSNSLFAKPKVTGISVLFIGTHSYLIWFVDGEGDGIPDYKYVWVDRKFVGISPI